MKFEIKKAAPYAIRDGGYKLLYSSEGEPIGYGDALPEHWDEAMRNEMYGVLLEGCGRVCEDQDGNLYGVVFARDVGGEPPKPLVWQRIDILF
jgi:hypothetical protein